MEMAGRDLGFPLLDIRIGSVRLVRMWPRSFCRIVNVHRTLYCEVARCSLSVTWSTSECGILDYGAC